MVLIPSLSQQNTSMPNTIKRKKKRIILVERPMCFICGIENLQRNKDGLACTLHEMMDGRWCCDGECDLIVLKRILAAQKKKI